MYIGEMERRRAAAVAIGVVVATAAVGFVAGSQVTSPAEVASRTAAPKASLILVPVESRVLSTEVVTRGTGRFGSPQKLSVLTSALKPGAGLVAELPLAGTEIAEGDVVASASGRPLFLLVGARPMSRDLGPGLSGDDVRQLEESLARLGFDVGAVDGYYDEATAAGVDAWYVAAGYAAFAATGDQLAAIRAREADRAIASFEVMAATDAVTSADAALTAARAASATAIRKSAASIRAVERAKQEAAAANVAAQQEVTAKQAGVDLLKSGRTALPGTPAQIRAAEADLAAARANEVAVGASGERAVVDAQAALDQAPARLDAARLAAQAADSAAAAEVAAKQAAFDESAADPAATSAQVAAASSDLITAQVNAATVHANGIQAVDDAQTSLTAAPVVFVQVTAQSNADTDRAVADVAAKELALSDLTNPRPPTSTELSAAQNELAIAVANSVTVRLAGERAVDEDVTASEDIAADVAVTAAAVVSADSTLANSRDALSVRADFATLAARESDLANRRAGVQVPADEVVFVASGPVRVADLLVVLGDPVTGAVMTVTDSVVHVDAGLALADAGLVAPGMKVHLEEPDLGIAAEGVVAVVASAPGTNGVDGFHVYVSIDVAAPPANLVGASVRLTIPVESSGKSVLAVPASALTLAADGSTRVQRSVGDITKFVTVIPGLSAAGYVEITSPDPSLREGELVVIGADQPTDGVAIDQSIPTSNAVVSGAQSTIVPTGGSGG